jgi:hypothetical protein
MTTCGTCYTNIKRGNKYSISCFSCAKLFHIDCVSLKQENIDYLTSSNKSWSCSPCVKMSKNTISTTACNPVIPLTSLSTGEPDLKLIISYHDNLCTEQTKWIDLVHQHNDKLNSFDKKFREISTQLSSIKNENTVLRNDLTAIKNRVDLLDTIFQKIKFYTIFIRYLWDTLS